MKMTKQRTNFPWLVVSERCAWLRFSPIDNIFSSSRSSKLPVISSIHQAESHPSTIVVGFSTFAIILKSDQNARTLQILDTVYFRTPPTIWWRNQYERLIVKTVRKEFEQIFVGVVL
jgi:hypothetical protein